LSAHRFPNNQKVVRNMVVSLETHGNRIVAGDVEDGPHFVSYNHIDNVLQLIADETVPRWLTTSCMPDYDTVAGADKFGNFFVSRLPASIGKELAEDQTGNLVAMGRPFLNGAPHRVCSLLPSKDDIRSAHDLSCFV
jgi:splicing factor 3B subunit 3